MKKVLVLGCGTKVSVDEEDVAILSRHKWRLDVDGIVVASMGSCNVKMHNLVFGSIGGGLTVDHADRNRLNNCKDNLRAAHYSEQNMNQGKRVGITGLRGVTNDLRIAGTSRPFKATVRKDGRRVCTKRFATAIEAATWRDEKVAELYGDFAILNFPKEASA